MILFLEDWDNKHPEAIWDLETSNESFVQLCHLYKTMGVKNHLFPLALHNRELKRINPFDDGLSQVEQGMVVAECKLNPWYFFREIGKAPPMAGMPARPIEGNRGNVGLWWSYFNHITAFLIQIRQTGKSFSMDMLDVLLMNVMATNTHINLLTKDEGLRAKNIARIKDIEGCLPRYMQMRGRDDTNNTEELSVKALGNSYKGHLPQKQAKMANNAARGYSSANFRVDEGPFQPNSHISLQAALPAGNEARKLARQAGAPFGTILTTTAGKKDEKEGAYFYRMVSDAAEWNERFFDASGEKELNKLVRTAARNGRFVVNITLNHLQVGKTDEWLQQAIEDAMADPDNPESEEGIKRDFFNEWTSGTQTNPISPETLKVINESEVEPNYTQIAPIGNYLLKWFVPEDQIKARMFNGSHYIMSCDTSDASGGDDISLRITDIRTHETVAAGTYNTTNIITFSEWIAHLIESYTNMTTIIERKSTGGPVLDNLLLLLPARGIDPFKRLWNRVVQEKDENREAYLEISQPMGRRPSDIYTRYKKAFGFPTSASGDYARSVLFSVIHQAARLAGHLVKDRSTIKQISALVTINGRIDHPRGEHDDMVIGWLLGFWFLTKGKNLTHYGMDVTQLLSDLRQKRVGVYDPVVAYRDQEQQRIRARIKELGDKLNEETDLYIIVKLEQELSSLGRCVVVQDNEKFSTEELIAHAREERKKKKQVAHTNVYDRYRHAQIQQTIVRDPTRFNLSNIWN